MRRPVPRLLLVTDPNLPAGLVASVDAALRRALPDVVGVQLRAKDLAACDLVEAGRALRALTAERGVALLVNGRVDVAIACGADGVHLPEAGMGVEDARRLLGPDALVGRSTHDAAGLARAALEGADYVTLGPVGHVAEKNPALGLEGFAALVRDATVPVLALGGVSTDDVSALLAAGAHGVAVVRAVLASSDPSVAVERILSGLPPRG